MDIRLDYIDKFKNRDEAIEEMTNLRNIYIELDARLSNLFEEEQEPALKRAFALCRTNLEISSMYAIKSCCLKYEDKDSE